MNSKQSPLIEAVFHHLVLPPKLPRKFDGDKAAIVQNLGKRLHEALATLRPARPSISGALDASLRATKDVNRGFLAGNDLRHALRGVVETVSPVWLALHVTQQNAALLIHVDATHENIIFESFQVSAPVRDVLNASHALTCDFPGRAVAVPIHIFKDESFQENLIEFLEQSSTEAFDQFAARASKGGESIVETRDCPSPALVNDMLMSLLEGLGKPTTVRQIRKRVRDDVVLDSSEVPWRRSPYWLVLRVAVGRQLSNLYQDEGSGRAWYKFLICVVLANLVRDCVGSLHPEMTLMLQAKLCRRLAKLESEQKAASGSLRIVYDNLFSATEGFFDFILGAVKREVGIKWEMHKADIVRRIPRLPTKIASTDDIILKLPNSFKFLRDLRSRDRAADFIRGARRDVPSLKEGTVSQVNRLTARYTGLIDHEANTKLPSSEDPEQMCIESSTAITKFLQKAGTAYKDNPLLMSRYLLRLFELWVDMDRAATTACPLLKQYHPIFVPQSLDVLCLLTMEEMERLARVQQYVARRVSEHHWKGETIFSNPRRETAFPLQFATSTSVGKLMLDVADEIDRKSEKARALKEAQLATQLELYHRLIQETEGLSCCCKRRRDGTKDTSDCQKCKKKQKRKNIKIAIHEDFLPEDRAHRAAIAFEFLIPKYLVAYRQATWNLCLLGSPPRPNRSSNPPPQVFLNQVDLLQDYLPRRRAGMGTITLASQKKLFTQTHYRKMRMPKTPREVMRPFGAEFSYYDTNLWAEDLPKTPWFQHLLGPWLPGGIPDPCEEYDQSEETLYHPTSYEIVANELNCPPDMSTHEFSAYQRVVSGRGRRWLTMLTELSSTNINFSTEVSTTIFTRIALQAGPSVLEHGVLREAHVVFDDQPFCETLHDRLSCWLASLESTCREVHCMSTIVTLSFRLYHLCPQGFKEKAHELLVRIRHITSNWIVQLRNEVRATPEGETARKASDYAFRAALLCRQTFSIHADDAQGQHAILTNDDMTCFFRASIALQEHLLVSVDDLSLALKSLLILDLSNCYHMRFMVRDWIEKNPRCLEDAINETWSDAGDLGRRYSGWTFLEGYHAWWATARVEGTNLTGSQEKQVVHYHLVQGHLTVDGMPLGRLPLEMREDPAIRELFGGQHLLTRPSSILEHQLVNQVEGHQIHFGFRKGKVIIQAIFRGALLEHVPRSVFKGETGYDLPSPLVDDCVHWLNLNTGQMEMRRKPRIWTPRLSNWVFDLRSRYATRNYGRRTRNGPLNPGTYLVDPRSAIAQKIYRIFQGFEDADKLTIYQPRGGGSLSVEMKRLEIRFFVNAKGLLQCPQLNAEVDPRQDVGALYGLCSHILLRGVANSDNKSIIVPIGSMRWQRSGMHVAVTLQNTGMYAKFTVNQLLGRLDCPPEPLLLYLKAALHALTSFPLPDKLTGRTGTEEARHCLLAASSQPWTPLQGFSRPLLAAIRSLSPKRSLYPPGLDIYQKVKWDDHLTMTIQHEGLAPLVDNIVMRSEELETFDQTAKMRDEFKLKWDDDSIESLRLRGRIRRQVYERVCFPGDSAVLHAGAKAFPYSPSEHPASKQSCQTYQTTRALRDLSAGISHLPRLTPIVEQWETLAGLDRVAAKLDIRIILDLDISELWGSFLQACLGKHFEFVGAYDEYFRLALLAFDSNIDMRIVSWFVAFSKNSALRNFETPNYASFANFHAFEAPSETTLRDLILIEQPTYADWLQESSSEPLAVTEEQYYDIQVAEAASIASHIIDKGGPGSLLSLIDFEELVQDLSIERLDLETAWQNIQPELERLSRNLELSVYLLQVDEAAREIRQQQSQAVSDKHNEIWNSKPAVMIAPEPGHARDVYTVPHLTGGLMKKDFDFDSATKDETSMDKLSRTFADTSIAQDDKAPETFFLVSPEIATLSRVVKRFSASPDLTRQQYGNDLEASLAALIRHRKADTKPTLTLSSEGLAQAIAQSRQLLHDHISTIRESVSQGESSFRWLDQGNLWPCLSPVTLLEQLRDRNKSHLSRKMKEELLLYGIIFTKLQRFVRMHDAELSKDEKRLRDELEHEGHSNWSPREHPEWLLLEIDNNILIRPSQVDVARAIISPASGSNSVLQMNMGQGKTSCVMPMAVTVLADKTQLCRLVVPRALLLQTAQVLQSRIGGLVGRQVCHIPFSRRSPTEEADLNLYHGLHRDVRATGGVMLCLPEHILSFRLSGFQEMADQKLERAKKMIVIQRWLDSSCRDILDESDFTLSARTQLIYPSGVPTAVDGHPQRWRVVEDLLALVESHISDLQSDFKDGIDVRRRHQGYPIIHFLRSEAEDSLNALLVADICEGRLPQLQLKDPFNQDAQKDIGMIVSGVDVPQSTWKDAAEALADDVFGWKMLHLLRGLISQRVLLLCLKKRWNVQYGLHPQRAPIAVPYEAKGVPSETAEYGHPDTALVLTCLAFYQTGLSKAQVDKSLQHIMKSDDPAAHYERLISTCSLPAGLQQWNLLDTEDKAQMAELWEFVRFDRNVLNHFLNNFAFPQHAKQFGVKLQASGWDIPLLSSVPSSKNLTTGFSGTNDNKRTLPHTIKQDDLPSLMQTNAEVLSYLLESRNQKLYPAVDRNGKHLTETGLLELLRNEKIRILIDAGAHILEMENHDLASAWLDIFHDADGAVYFDNQSRIMVRARFQKEPVPLLASPFVDNLERCVVYIDEAHTRGTDLKLPVYAKAAVTLGLGQTKDQTVQAAMRLRQLGTTQSVSFVAPPEVYQSILRLRTTYSRIFTKHLPVTSEDVVHWLLEQSCVASENIISLHLAQGYDFCRRTNALWKHMNLLQNEDNRRQLLETIQLREDQTLEQLYGVRQLDFAEPSQFDFPSLEALATKLHEQRLTSSRSDHRAHSSPFEEVEQEREIEFEVEQVREVQRPTRLVPLFFPSLDPAIIHFVNSGCLAGKRFIQAFDLIGRTGIGRKFGVTKTTSQLFVSPEFARTVEGKKRSNIVRPVEWILLSTRSDTALIIIPEEAELLLPTLRELEKPRARLISYAAPVAKSMQMFNTLKYLTIPAKEFSVPAWLPIEVGVFAGRLYFDYHEYESLLSWLGIGEVTDSQVPVSRGFWIRQPLKFLLEWMTHRRQTADILHTPMGYVCQGRALHDTHAFFSSTTKLRDDGDVSSALGRLQIGNGQLGGGNASDDDSEWEDGDMDAQVLAN
ncbi:hypothetical protein NCS52_00940700 [Fusarium sp. LHS14.1]|nr:hypothetical protein NCS52_00940700 [Fusarium sp. LHS14.1]